MGTLAKPVEGHAKPQTRRAVPGPSIEHGMTFRMRPASKMCRRPAAIRRLRPQNNSAGLPSPMFPPTSLAAAVPAAHPPTEKTQRIEAEEKRCGEENRHLRFSSPRLQFMNGHALKGFARIRASMVFVVVSFQEKLGLGFYKFVLIPNAVLISCWSSARWLAGQYLRFAKRQTRCPAATCGRGRR